MKVLVPLDGSTIGESAVPYVLNLLSTVKPEIHPEVVLFHAVPEEYDSYSGRSEGTVIVPLSKEKKELIIQQSNEYLTKVGKIFVEKDIPVTVKTSTGSSVAYEIVNAAEQEKVYMIAMSTHGRSGISRLAYGSVTYKVLHLETHIPVIVIKASKK